MSKFVVSIEAAKDIEHYRQYLIEQNQESVSEEFLIAIYEKFGLLAEYPGMGKSRNDLLPGLFSFPEIKYRRSIFYIKSIRGINILRVLGGYQEHQRILKAKE